MGIKDLLRFMKPYIEPIHIKKYSGKRVGIDAYSWLHKGSYSCSMELCLNSDNEKKLRYIDYFMHRVNLLRHHEIIPIVVFDGGDIPCKADTKQGRDRIKTTNHDLAMEKLKEGNVEAATEFFKLLAEAKIPNSACLKPYEVRDSQGVVWVWMSQKTSSNPAKLPWFENFERPGFQDTSTIHEVPYDHSITLENLMDPAHVPISHDRTDFFSKREDAQALRFKVTERTDRGFAGWWGKATEEPLPNFLKFESPCFFQNNREMVDKKTGEKNYFTGLFLCRPSGQGKSMVIIRFGGTKRPFFIKLFPKWYFHQNACKVLEQDMGFLSSQNEVLIKEKMPTKELYINLKSSDTWVVEYRKWMDKVGHGMPYHGVTEL